MRVEYIEKHSHSAADHAPLDAGIYAVKLANGKTNASVWDGSAWDADVSRFSGRNVTLTPAERAKHTSNILAGINVPEGHRERQVAQASALALARHSAARLVKSGDEAQKKTFRGNMCGWYKVAQALLVSFDHNQATAKPASHDAYEIDRALLGAHWRRLDEIQRMRINAIVAESQSGPDMQEWLQLILHTFKDLDEERQEA